MIMTSLRGIGIACVVLLLGCVTASTAPAADREKLLSEPGVYGTFAAFRIDPEWGRLEQALRISQLTAMKGVVEQHREKLAIDSYLLRGLSDHADFLLSDGIPGPHLGKGLCDPHCGDLLRGKERGNPPLDRVFIVFETDTKNIVTAFPR